MSTATTAVSIVIFGFVTADTVTLDNPDFLLQHSSAVSCALKRCLAFIVNNVSFRFVTLLPVGCYFVPMRLFLYCWRTGGGRGTTWPSFVVILIKLAVADAALASTGAFVSKRKNNPKLSACHSSSSSITATSTVHNEDSASTLGY